VLFGGWITHTTQIQNSNGWPDAELG